MISTSRRLEARVVISGSCNELLKPMNTPPKPSFLIVLYGLGKISADKKRTVNVRLTTQDNINIMM